MSTTTSLRRHRWSPRLLALALCLGLCGLVFGAVGASATSKASVGTIKIGLILPASGQYQSAGLPERLGAQMKADELNAAGHIMVGNKPYKLQLLIQDDQSSPSQAVADATQLITQDGVKVLLGPVATMALGTLPFARQANVIQYTPATSAGPYIGTSDYPYLFGAVSTAVRVNSSVDAIRHWVKGVTKVAFLGPNDSTATTLVGPITNALKAKGIAEQTFLFPSGSTDLSTVLTQLAAYKPDVIFLGAGSVPTDTLTLKQLDGAGISKSVPTFGWGVPVSVGVASPGREFIASPLSWADFTVKNAPKPLKDYRNRFLKSCGCSKLPPYSSASILFYDVVGMMVAAMQAARSTTDTNAIASSLVKIAYKGTGVTLHMDPKTHTINTGLDVTLLKNGTTQTLAFY